MKKFSTSIISKIPKKVIRNYIWPYLKKESKVLTSYHFEEIFRNIAFYFKKKDLSHICCICNKEIEKTFTHNNFQICKKHLFSKYYITYEIKDAIRNSQINFHIEKKTGTILCPINGCNQTADGIHFFDFFFRNKFKILISNEDNYYDLLKKRASLIKYEKYGMYCPNIECNLFFLCPDKIKDRKNVKCGYCNYQLCLNCKTFAHPGVSCEQNQKKNKLYFTL